MTLTGVLIVAIPLTAAVLAARRRRFLMTGGLVLLVLALLVPAVLTSHDARNKLQDARRADRTACVYFVGGYDCPGD